MVLTGSTLQYNGPIVTIILFYIRQGIAYPWNNITLGHVTLED